MSRRPHLRITVLNTKELLHVPSEAEPKEETWGGGGGVYYGILAVNCKAQSLTEQTATL